jgi:hypothetical protein
MGGRGSPIVGVLAASNPDIDPVLRALPLAQWSGMKMYVFLRNGSPLNANSRGSGGGTPSYVVAMIWLDACRLQSFRSAYPTVCR